MRKKVENFVYARIEKFFFFHIIKLKKSNGMFAIPSNISKMVVYMYVNEEKDRRKRKICSYDIKNTMEIPFE